MKLIYGRDLGISLSAALSGIDIYDGKMELSANLIAALVEAHPHYAYAIVELTSERCELEFFKTSAASAPRSSTSATPGPRGSPTPSTTRCPVARNPL